MKTIVSACMLLAVGTAHGRELTGVVYWDHGGPTGHATGMLGIATRTGIVPIHYQKPYKARFASSSCTDVGAIWTVRMQPIDGGGEELESASCAGSVDVPIHSAWLAVKSYITSTAEAAGYKLGFQLGRRGPLPARMNGINVDLFGYLSFGLSGMCLEMSKQVNRETIVIRSSSDCYFDPDLEFRVIEVQTNVWRVDSVKAIDPERPSP